MPDLSPQIYSLGLTLFLFVSSATSTIKEILNGSRAKAKSPLTKGEKDDAAAPSVGNKIPRARARRNSLDTYSTIESHIVRSLLVILLLFAVYKLIMVELPHRDQQQNMSLSQIPSVGTIEQWEYAIGKKTLSEAELNALGNEGWELISHKFEIESKLDTYIFKRRKS